MQRPSGVDRNAMAIFKRWLHFQQTEPCGILVRSAQVSPQLKSLIFAVTTLATRWKEQRQLPAWHYHIPAGTVPPYLNSKWTAEESSSAPMQRSYLTFPWM